MATLRRHRLTCFAHAAALVLLAACVDPDGRYEDFIERTADMRRGGQAAPDGGLDAGDAAQQSVARFDFSGTYLLALSTTLAPDAPLLLACDVTVAEDLNSIDLVLQPLTTDMDAMPRERIGDSIRVDAVPYAEDGSFSVDFGEVAVPGRANPISGADIVAAVAITARANPMTGELPVHFCGEAGGMVLAPLAFDLTGSTFGAVATDDLTAAEPLPACPD